MRTAYSIHVDILEEMNIPFIEYRPNNCEVYVIEIGYTYSVYVSKFRTTTGRRMKNIKYLRESKETSKGRYIVLDRKRVYIPKEGK